MIRGFIDLQVNGWSGIDFSAPNLTVENCVKATRGILEAGTAAFMPTIITSGMDIYENNLPVIAQVRSMPEFKDRILGVHLEGPFISSKDGARGAHPLTDVRHGDTEILERLIKLSEGCVKLLTVAADALNADKLIKMALENDICVSLGHQLASSAEINAAAAAGASAVTHLGNGMPAMVNRHTNPLVDCLACDALTAMIITDGHHLPDSLIKIILKVKGADKVVITSDATALSGLPPGTYEMFGATVKRDNSGKVYNPETGYLAGSGSSILECMNYLASLDLLSKEELLNVGFSNALALINVELPDNIVPPIYDQASNCFKIN